MPRTGCAFKSDYTESEWERGAWALDDEEIQDEPVYQKADMTKKPSNGNLLSLSLLAMLMFVVPLVFLFITQFLGN